MSTVPVSTELEAARRVVEIARKYRDWMFGASVTPDDKRELIDAVDAYDEVVGETSRIEQCEIERCPKCGSPHPDKVIQFAKVFGASEALCRKCTAIEKRERFGITDEP